MYRGHDLQPGGNNVHVRSELVSVDSTLPVQVISTLRTRQWPVNTGAGRQRYAKKTDRLSSYGIKPFDGSDEIRGMRSGSIWSLPSRAGATTAGGGEPNTVSQCPHFRWHERHALPSVQCVG